MPIARSIRVTGHVQGVFFREWTLRVAGAFQIAGWVRNRRDGSVEVYAVGRPEQMERFIAKLHKGAPAARVDEVAVHAAQVENVTDFMRRGTL